MLEACTGWDGSQNRSKTGEGRQRVSKAKEEACSEETVKKHETFGEVQKLGMAKELDEARTSRGQIVTWSLSFILKAQWN